MSATAIANPEIISVRSIPKSGAFLRLEKVAIEDIWGAGTEAVERLRQALNAGTYFRRDAKRKRIYEVQVDKECFYIHVMGDERKILLLALWSA